MLLGCNATVPPKVITLVERDVAYVPYPSCPAPNKFVPSMLPLDYVNKTTDDNALASAYVETVARLKADVKALLIEIARYQKAHDEAKTEEQKIKDANTK